MGVLNRCVFIEGIGRCHVIGPRDNPEVAVMDSFWSLAAELRATLLASDILTGNAPGRILWSVRFKEHSNAS